MIDKQFHRDDKVLFSGYSSDDKFNQVQALVMTSIVEGGLEMCMIELEESSQILVVAASSLTAAQ